jgi:hypothetical protein
MGHYVSFVIQSWQDDHDSTMSWRVRCVRDPEPLHLPDGSFVVRTWIDDTDTVRGLIRHVQSGREMQFQSGKNALAFIHAWMDSGAPPADPDSDSEKKGPADG